MKEFRLSTSAERAASGCFTAGVLAIFGVLLYALRNDVMLMIFCGLGMLLVGTLLVMYVLNALKATAVVDAENKKLYIKGLTRKTYDVSNAVLLQTVAKKNGQTTIRVLVFSDQDENIVAVVPTMFTFRQGMWADPMAKEMAAEFGIEFQQNVPDWEFDKEKYKQHVEEETAREKQEAKERREKRMKLRIEKYKKQR